MVSEIFLTFSVTSFIGCILSIGALAYRSKCKEVTCCCLKIIRDVVIEEEEDLESMRMKREGGANGTFGEVKV